MPNSPLAIIEVTQEALDNIAEDSPGETNRNLFGELSKSIQEVLLEYGVHAMVFGPGVTLAGVVSPAPDELPDVDEEDNPSEDEPQGNPAKTPGQVAYERFYRDVSGRVWNDAHELTREFWEDIAASAITRHREVSTCASPQKV